MTADDRPMMMDLARVAPFALGELRVQPATREVVADGASQVLEPRIMQVLVALARRRGAVVSRDGLVDACWGGRAVSDDAINRCIAAIRRLAADSGAFTVTTVTKVGYRLDAADEPSSDEPRPDGAGQGVFLSYARSDRAFAVKIVEGLRRQGFEVWWDEDMHGVDWQLELERKLKELAAIVVVWTTVSSASEQVRDEARLGLSTGKLVNVLAGVSAPPFPYDRINGLPLGDWDGDSGHPAWQRLTTTIAGLLGFTIENAPGGPLDTGKAGPADRSSPIKLAVLAFDSLGGDPKTGRIAEGVADEVLHILAQRSGLMVVGRSTSFAFSGPEKAARNVGRQLGVTHVLDGSVRHNGSRVRISVQLVSCATEATIWSLKLESDLSDVFALEEQVAASAAAALSHAVSGRPPSGPIDPHAYDLYLQARTSVESWLGGGDADLLTQAVSAAPSFAAGWASLALTRAVQWRAADSVGPAERAAREQAIEAADTALALDPQAGAAHIARSLLLPRCGAYEEEDAHMQLALTSAERDPWTLFHAARAAECKGRLNEALAYAQRAHEIEPYWPQGMLQLASILDDIGQASRSEALFDEMRAKWPTLDYVTITALFRAAQARHWSRVDQLTESLRSDGPFGERTSAALRRIDELRQEAAADALAKLERERRRIAETGAMSLNIALLCRDGHADEAFDLAERASFAHLFEPDGRFVKWDQGTIALFFASGQAMRSDPRFTRLCAKLGLASYWLATGRWPDCVAETAGRYDFKEECRRAAGSRR
jgi:adenylate cyclase